jgi:glyoxylase-like metal-dependent hydrolase (beta-lactamase superfamily II)
VRPLGSTAAWAGGRITPRAEAVLAPNPGWMTLDGTNSWLLVEPGADEAVLVDPGPDDPGHREALVAAAARHGALISRIVLTHGHADHAAGARGLHERTGAPVHALDARHRLGSEGLADGDVIVVGGLELRVVGTPGHTRDSLSLLLVADGALLTGDTVLGRGTAVIAHPDGDLGDYLDTLDRLAGIVDSGLAAHWLLPGHGPALDQPAQRLAAYRAHRIERLARVRAAWESGITDLEALLDAAYPEVGPDLRWAARLSLRAQVEHLARTAGPGLAR